MERTVPFNAFPTSNRGGGSGEESAGGGAMKRRSIDGSDGGGDPRVAAEEEKNKKPRSDEGKAEVTAEEEEEEEVNVAELGEDLVLEVLKRADARTLGRAACVSRRWRRLAEDERLWEAVCTRDWVRVPYGERQLRSVVLALGGFRRLHSLYILPFLGTSGPRTAASSPALALPSAAATSPSPMTRRAHLQPRWGKDEVQLSLALLSIGFFEKMNPNNNHRGGGGGGGGCG